MLLKQISTLRLVLKRVTDLDLWRLTLLFFKAIRQQGLFTAVKKSWHLLFWDQGLNYLNEAQQWYQQEGCSDIPENSEQLLAQPNILIVGALDLPQCKKYRVLQKVELLETMGFNCEISEYRDIPRVFNKIQLATLVLFYRVPDGDLFKLYLNESVRLKIRMGYDIDDPIFAPDVYAENKNLDMLSSAEKKQLLESSTEYRDAIQQCDFISVSTPGMYELADSLFDKSIFLWRNVLDGETLSIVNGQTQKNGTTSASEENIVIAYMSGSRAHDADFATIEHVLAKIMAKYPHVHLLIGGYASVTGELQDYKQRIQQFPFSGYAGYFKHLSQADICVVPLLQDRFNNCKSAIRYLEAAIIGVPVVAANIGDFQNVIKSGENGFLAASREEWQQALEKLITDKQLRKNLGTNSQLYVKENQTITALSQSMKSDLSLMLQKAV